MSNDDLARHAALSEAEIETAALGDPDNPPSTPEELERMASVRRVRQARASTGLIQADFGRTYRINVARLRDLEQGRTTADSALLAYLTVIVRAPDVVRRALNAA